MFQWTSAAEWSSSVSTHEIPKSPPNAYPGSVGSGIGDASPTSKATNQKSDRARCLLRRLNISAALRSTFRISSERHRRGGDFVSSVVIPSMVEIVVIVMTLIRRILGDRDAILPTIPGPLQLQA